MINLYKLKRKKGLDKIFEKLAKRDIIALEAVQKKAKQIIQDPYRFKPLSNKMKKIRRVHIKSHFVLTYKIYEKEKIVELLDYDHHDKIYKNRR
jgi:YafQ family addiction module toxin component